jgi:F-box domain
LSYHVFETHVFETQEKCITKKQNGEILALGRTNVILKEKLLLMKKKARALKDRFIVDIGGVLRDFKSIDKTKRTIEENEVKLRESNLLVQQQQDRIKVLEDELAFLQMKLSENESQELCDPGGEFPEKKLSISDLDDSALLMVFSFLDTMDVISAAQTCKSLYTRVGVLFGIEGSFTNEMDGAASIMNQVEVNVAKSDELTLADPVTDKMLVQIDELSKKLSGYELKLILSMTERLKVLSRDLELAQTEKEDITANIQSAETVRDFLVEKLKGAEIALKSAIGEIAQLKKQSDSDQEMIAYLDLRTNELEIENADVLSKCQNIEGTMEVQSGSHSYMERLLTNEVEDFKHRLEISESTFKLQKKVLVKEVKSLRSKMDEVVHERDQCKLQMQRFRDALSSNSTIK